MRITLLASFATATLFTLLGPAPAQCVPQWGPLGTGVLPSGSGWVASLQALSNGDVVVGGSFGFAGGVPAANVARWDGVSWSAMGAGVNGGVQAITELPNGDVVIGGAFGSATPGVVNIARWDGTSWLPLGAGLNSTVRALTTLPNGDVVAGGDFSVTGGSSIARWDGSNWNSMGVMSSRVFSLTTLASGDVVAGGQFTTAGGVSARHVARWNGAGWSAMGTGLSGTVVSLTRRPNGDVIATGGFGWTGPGGPPGAVVSGIARWDGVSWSAMGSTGLSRGVGIPGAAGSALTTLPNGDVVVGGLFEFVDGVAATNIARWDGSGWSAVGSGVGNTVGALTNTPNGDLFAGGSFTSAGGVSANNIARWADCPATAVAYGSGCVGTGGPNVLVADTLPVLGQDFVATATGMPSAGVALFVLGFTQASIPLSLLVPQGQPGCDALMTLDFVVPLQPTAGVLETRILMPGTSNALGFTFLQQVMPVDSSGPALVLTSTNALRVTIGT